MCFDFFDVATYKFGWCKTLFGMLEAIICDVASGDLASGSIFFDVVTFSL